MTGFEYQWVRFFLFRQGKGGVGCSRVSRWTRKEKCPSPYTTGKPDISCRVEELNQYVPEAGNDNR